MDPPAAGAQMSADSSDAGLHAQAHWDAGGTSLGICPPSGLCPSDLVWEVIGLHPHTN